MREPAPLLWVWRHPRAEGAAGRCIGWTDLPVDPRRAKRLAHRIRQAARRHGLPRRVLTSPLQRCAAVGRWLKRWGWAHERDPALREMHFGHWDGLRWEQIGQAELDAWCSAFARHRPGGGEHLQRYAGTRRRVAAAAGAGRDRVAWRLDAGAPLARIRPPRPRAGRALARASAAWRVLAAVRASIAVTGSCRMARSVMVWGTSSGAGKSLLVDRALPLGGASAASPWRRSRRRT